MALEISLVCGVVGIVGVPLIIWASAYAGVVVFGEFLPVPIVGLVLAAVSAADEPAPSRRVQHAALFLNGLSTLLIPVIFYVASLSWGG
jgi:hypothetical protein